MSEAELYRLAADELEGHGKHPEAVRMVYEHEDVRIKLLTIHAKTLKNNVEMPDDALTGQFKFLMTKYYNADVHTSLSDVPDEYFV